MRICRFEQVIVIGCGDIVCTVLRYMAQLKEKYFFDLLYIQHELQGLNAAEGICAESGIPVKCLLGRAEVSSYLINISKKTWIISAGNYYIFPREIVDKGNLTIINFHNALLPKYPGRNAPSWAIYNKEVESGATWHYVTSDVDAGRIIWQERCSITKDTKAYELTHRIMELAQLGLETFGEKILNSEVKGTAQKDSQRKMYYSYEVPGGGMFCFEDPVEDIYRLLRSLDYGKLGPFGKPVTILPDGKTVKITRYKIKSGVRDPQERMITDTEIVMRFDEQTILSMKYKAKETSYEKSSLN